MECIDYHIDFDNSSVKYTYVCLHVQAKYCSEECRQSAWDQHHRTLCLGENEGDPSHPFEQLQEAWRLLQYTMWKFELFTLLCEIFCGGCEK